jgi:hypothetical protein
MDAPLFPRWPLRSLFASRASGRSCPTCSRSAITVAKRCDDQLDVDG